MTIFGNLTLRPSTDPDDPDDFRPRSSWAPLADIGDGGSRVDSMSVVVDVCAPGDRVPLHVHPIDELILVEGDAEVTVGDRASVLTAGAIGFVPAGVPHGGRASGEAPVRFVGVFPSLIVGSEYLERNPYPGTEGDPPRPISFLDVRAAMDEMEAGVPSSPPAEASGPADSGATRDAASPRTDVETERTATLALLKRTRESTRRLLAELDPEAVAHDEPEPWRVRDVVGHLAVWNGEAARSLEAHASGGEYTCLDAPALYDGYNAPAVRERKDWPLVRVWDEYKAMHDRLEAAIETMPAPRWDAPTLYPWNERGSVVGLVVVMTEHETGDHCEPITARLG